MYKRIGILGGLTPESTIIYYQYMVRSYQESHGDHGYPEIVIYSVSFQRYEDWMNKGSWSDIETGLLEGLTALEVAGADFAVIATNTMHMLFQELEEKSSLELISIIDTTAEAIKEAELDTVGLLGTRFTMENPFYREGLREHGINTLVPGREDMEIINEVIFEELSRGIMMGESRKEYLRIIDDLVTGGAEGIVLGCTEIPLLITPEHTDVPLFDTAILHAERALQYAIAD
jgi:aspartate racemase